VLRSFFTGRLGDGREFNFPSPQTKEGKKHFILFSWFCGKLREICRRGNVTTRLCEANHGPISNLELQIARSAVLSYGLAALSVSVALGAALLLERFHFRNVADPLFLLAIARNRLVCRDWASNIRRCSLRPRRHLFFYRADLRAVRQWICFAQRAAFLCGSNRQRPTPVRTVAGRQSGSIAHPHRAGQ